jgi:hypothetical protein
MDRGFAVRSFRRCALRYLRSWFAVDLVACLPYPRFAGGASWGKKVDLLSLLRLLRLARVFLDARSFLGADNGGAALRVVLVLFAWLLASHLLACVWYFLGTATCAPRYTTHRVLTHPYLYTPYSHTPYPHTQPHRVPCPACVPPRRQTARGTT